MSRKAEIMTTQALNRERAIIWYRELMQIIDSGAYSESDPDGESDGSYWHDDVNITEEIDRLEECAQREGLKFISPAKYKYDLVEMTDEEKAELARIQEAHRSAGIVAAFQWQDEGTPATVDYTYFLGKVPDTQTYIMLIEGTADSGFGYTYPVKRHISVSFDEDGKPTMGDPTKKEIAQAKANNQ